MKHNYPYLKDKDFLKKIDMERIKTQYVKIVILNFETEKPIDEIQGKVTSGNVNVDGNSAVRRTANLSMVPDEKYRDNILSPKNLLSMNKKVDICIGYKNTFGKYNSYDIIWFPIGLFIITGMSLNKSVDNLSISLQLKDKMCLLNGDVGGLFPASVLLNEMEVTTSVAIPTDNSEALDGKYKDELVSTSKVEDEAVNIEEDGDISLILDKDFTFETESIILKPTIFQIVQELVNHFGNEQLGKIIISDLPLRTRMVMQYTGNAPLYGYYTTAAESQIGSIAYSLEKPDWEKYRPVVNETTPGSDGIFSYGDNVGYIYTDFTYPGELTANAGESVCSVLDKIVATLGNYEYFYDVDGYFHFQEKKNYLYTTQAKIEADNIKNKTPDYIIDMTKGKSVYSFTDGMIVNSISNNPNYDMIKNDFIVWGKRKTATGLEIPIRYRLAIDDKPKVGNTYEAVAYIDAFDNIKKYKVPTHYNKNEDFPKEGTPGLLYEAQGQIYYYDTKQKKYVLIEEAIITPITTTDWRSELYLTGTQATPLALNSSQYFEDLASEWPKQYDLEAGEFKQKSITDYDYFLDFIDTNSAVGAFSVANIGRRQKVVTDDKVNCLFEPGIPDFILINKGSSEREAEEAEAKENGSQWTQVDTNVFSALAGGHNYNSAYYMVRDLLYQYTSYNETISLTTLPIYYLEPNTRITVEDVETGVYGDYMINSFSISLAVGGTMTFSATRVLESV